MGTSSIVMIVIVVLVGAILATAQEEAMYVPKTQRLACTGCGAECSATCGTKLFRTCCLSFARKRAAAAANISRNPEDGSKHYNDSDEPREEQNLSDYPPVVPQSEQEIRRLAHQEYIRAFLAKVRSHQRPWSLTGGYPWPVGY